MKQLLNEVKRMQKLAGIISESVKVEDDVKDKEGNNFKVIATDEQNEMDITLEVAKALESKGASESDFAILVPINSLGEYDYDLSGNQFLDNVDAYTIKKRTEL